MSQVNYAQNQDGWEVSGEEYAKEPSAKHNFYLNSQSVVWVDDSWADAISIYEVDS